MGRILERGSNTAKSLGKGIFEVKILEAGWGSSGYYSPELIKEYGPSTFKEGRPSFANHPTEAEFANGRDVTKIMGRLIGESEVREDNNLWGKIKVRPEWIDFVEEYKDTIGVSIFASGSISEGEAEGRKGNIVESFDPEDPYTSVDFVVAAGAGGKVERMLESFKAKEGLSSDRREQLSNLVKDAYREDNTYVWVRDFDESNGVVYFDMESAGEYGVFQQAFSLENDVAVQLEGERTEVRTVTSYVPVSESISKENGMTPEEKAELAALVATAVTEALKPAPVVAADEDGPVAATPAEVAEAVREADLPAASEKRVFESLTADATKEIVAEVIAKEKQFAESLLKDAEVEVPGRVREADTATPTSFIVSDWN